MDADTLSSMSHDEVNLAWRDVTYEVPVKVKVEPAKQKTGVADSDANNATPPPKTRTSVSYTVYPATSAPVRSWRSWVPRAAARPP